MFRAILWTQWKWLRAFVLAGGVILFTMPIYSVWNFSDPDVDRWRVNQLLDSMQVTSVFYALLALFLGMLVAAGTWQYDMRAKHVYALSLPIARWHYVLLRFAAGAILLIIPSLLLYIGSLAAVSSTAIPSGLQAYPLILALRFLLASFLSYAVVLAMSSMPQRILIGVIVGIGVLLFVDALLGSAGIGVRIMDSLFDIFVKELGFFDVFIARWMLIDV